MTTALDSSFFEFFEFWIWTNHNSLLSIATNQFASFCIDIRSRHCYFRVCQSGEIWNKKAFFSVYFNFLLYKTNRFHDSVRLFSNTSQMTSECGRTSVTHSVVARVPLFCSYHIFICDLLLNRRTQHGIYLLNINLSHHAVWNDFLVRLLLSKVFETFRLCPFQFASYCCGWLQIIFISGLFFD